MERSEVYPNVGLVLSQRMVLLENTSACLTTSKASLRSNVEALRKDISDTFSHQLALIRAREQEVLRQLQYEAEKRECALSSQQQYVHKLIGACQMAMDSISKGENSANYEGLLSRMPHTDNNSKLNGTLVFERDSLKMRSIIGAFGSVKFEPECIKSPITHGGSLPVEMEEYDDHVGMTHHKSVMNFKVSQNPTPTTPHGRMESIEKWLAKVPIGADVDALLAEFEEIKTSPAKEDTSETASFEVISESSSKRPTALSDELVEIMHRPLADWLLNAVPLPEQPKDVPPELRCMKRRHSYDTPVQAKKYGFQNVMQEIRDSNFKDWYNPKKDEITAEGTFDVPTFDELPGLSATKFNEAKFLDSLRKVFAGNTKVGEEPAKRRANLTMDSVMYWKNLLDRIQDSQKWINK